MRRIVWAVTGVLLLPFGCSHQEATAQSQSSSSAWQQAKGDFASAYGAVKSGVERSATAGKYALKDVGNGVVRVTDQSKRAIYKGGEAVSDGWITTKLESKYAVDKDVKMSNVGVETNGGVVRLTGNVDNAREAKRAIDMALDTKGVVAVDSDLQYPTRRQPGRVYTPTDRPQ